MNRFDLESILDSEWHNLDFDCDDYEKSKEYFVLDYVASGPRYVSKKGVALLARTIRTTPEEIERKYASLLLTERMKHAQRRFYKTHRKAS